MAAPAIKIKRKIVPTLVAEVPTVTVQAKASAPKVKGPPAINAQTVAQHNMAPSTYQQEFLDYAQSKDYLKELEERAVAKGYSKEKKPAKEKKPRKPKSEAANVDHGGHGQYLNDFNEYALELLKLKKHGKNGSLYDYLHKQFSSGKFYSTGSKRFRRVGSGVSSE